MHTSLEAEKNVHLLTTLINDKRETRGKGEFTLLKDNVDNYITNTTKDISNIE